MKKQIAKQLMLSLETRDVGSARAREREREREREKYLEYVGSTRLDRSGPIEDDDEHAQAELASDLSEPFEETVLHSHSDRIEKLLTTDFGPKSKIESSAVLKVGGRFFVIAVSTATLSATATRSWAS
ncbi:hypothetical protein [Bradyrhizobium sp. Rc2d]|uniref:hypothetical protein n=1 Tax=Bradyrhizobium sp. Rc2d TaxID=1855321 RepID=UPI001FCD0789|nr:hypothetical protein [Bradyrhizobium sp. Rc2d]